MEKQETAKKDWLVLKLDQPVEYQGTTDYRNRPDQYSGNDGTGSEYDL